MQQNREKRRKQQGKNGAKKRVHEEFKMQIGNIMDKINAEDTLREKQISHHRSPEQVHQNNLYQCE